MDPKGLVNIASRFAVKNSPTILVTLGSVSVIASVGMAITATPKALEVRKELESYLDSLHETDPEDEPKAKIFVRDNWYRLKQYAPIYAPTAIAAGGAIGMFIGANHIQIKRNEMLLAAYSLSERALAKYQGKIVEKLGEKTHMEVVDDIAKDETHQNPYNRSDVIVTSAGETRCYDAMSGRYFLSDINTIRKAENAIIKRLRDEMCCTLNDFYEELGLPSTKTGEIVGWDVNDILLNVDYSPILDDDEQPCLSIDYQVGVLESKYHIF